MQGVKTIHYKDPWVELSAEQAFQHGLPMGSLVSQGMPHSLREEAWRFAWGHRGGLAHPEFLRGQKTAASPDAGGPSAASPSLLAYHPASALSLPLGLARQGPAVLTSLWGSPAAEKMGIF